MLLKSVTARWFYSLEAVVSANMQLLHILFIQLFAFKINYYVNGEKDGKLIWQF